MNLTAVIERLQSRLVPLVREVGGAAGLETAMRGNVVAPAAMVIPLADQASRTLPATGPVRQRIAQQFAVILVLETLRDTTGTEALVELASVRNALKDILVGWAPDAATGDVVMFTAGELVQFEGDGKLWWSDEFELMTSYRRT